MKWRLQLFLWAGVAALILPSSTPVFAQDPLGVLITEVQAGSSSSASEEFIELYNTDTEAIDITGWKIEYFPAAATNFDSPSRTISLNGTLEPNAYFLLASKDYLTEQADQSYSYVLAKSGGHVRLVRPDLEVTGRYLVRDLIGWGSALHAEGEAAPEVPGGSSLVRAIDEQGQFVDTDNNKADFVISNSPKPRADNDYPQEAGNGNDSHDGTVTTPPEDTQEPAPLPADTTPEATPPEDQLKPLQITELLPNPAPPQTDDEHEYVEIYNPNNEAVALNGYKLQTGNNLSYSFTFANTTIAANSYKAFYVSETGLILANGGGRARLIDPAGMVDSETAVYEEAEEGHVWVLLNGAWQWSTTATAGSPNLVTLPAIAAGKVKAAAAKSSTKSGSKSAAAKKPTAAKAKTASAKKTTKASKASTPDRASYEEPQEVSQVTPLHPGVLAAVGGLALLYGLYEYRQDIANRFYQFRRYREARRAAGKSL